MSASTIKTGIVHFGVGRFHRAHEALYVDELLRAGHSNWGICGVCMLPFDKYIFETLQTQKGKYHLIERDNDSAEVKEIASIVELIYGFLNPAEVFEKLVEPDVKLVTFTVTEAGYYFEGADRHLDISHANIAHDIANPDKPKTLYGYLAHGLFLRHRKDMKPFTVQCCDNIQGNGDLVKSLLLQFCEQAYPSLVAYIADNVAFPNSMVDRITPAASDEELSYIHNLNIADNVPVTAESFRQWVVEDRYCNDRPPWEEVGITVVEDVEPYEKIKVRLLNGGHVAIGFAGHLAGFDCVHEVAGAPVFQSFLRKFFTETSVTLHPVPGVDISQYQDMLIKRFSNSNVRDQVLRICKDGSAKIPGYILHTLRDLMNEQKPHTTLSFVLAAWMQFIEASKGDTKILDDPEAKRLLRLSAAANGDVSLFLADRGIFGDLIDSPPVVTDVQRWFDAITQVGIVEAVKLVSVL